MINYVRSGMMRIVSVLGRAKSMFRKLLRKNSVATSSVGESLESYFVRRFDFSKRDLDASQELMDLHRGSLDIKRVIWFIPSFEHAFWGGIYTIFRFAAYFKEAQGVRNSFVVIDDTSKEKITSAIAEAFPVLRSEEVCICPTESGLRLLNDVDATISTLWTTAYYSLKFNKTKRKFYFIQDFEPLFYQAGSASAQAEATYHFGFYGIANTISLKEIYEQQYNGTAEFFTPCVDTNIFYPKQANEKEKPLTVFFYARPGHPRNGFDLGIAALRRLKKRMGQKVRVVTAGAPWTPSDLGLEGVIENLGLLSYKETADLYRECDVGLVMMFTRHPSYLPLELMASGCLVVTNFNFATTWLLQDGVNCRLAAPSASSISDVLEEVLTDSEQRSRIIANGLSTIRKSHTDWEKEMRRIYSFMCDPDGTESKA